MASGVDKRDESVWAELTRELSLGMRHEVRTAPTGEVLRALEALPGVEIHQHVASKIVIVMEAVESGILGGRLAEIATWQGVLSANMVFEQVASLAEIGD